MSPSGTPEVKGHHDAEKHEIRNYEGIGVDELGVELQLDRAKEIKLLAKLDIALIPIIMLVYLSCFLDRSNIGSSPIALCRRCFRERKSCWMDEGYRSVRPTVLDCSLHILRDIRNFRNASRGAPEEADSTGPTYITLHHLVSDYNLHRFYPECWRPVCHPPHTWHM